LAAPVIRRSARAGRLLAAVLLAGCAAPAATPAPPLSVSLEQSRDNENRHLLQVVLDNPGPGDVEVVRLQLRGGGFVDVAPTVRGDVLRAGRRIAFPVAYGDADCARTTPARVVLGHREGGALREVVLDVPADDPLLPRLRRRECDLEELAAAAGLSFADDAWERTGLVATGRAVVRREQGREPVELASLEGTVVFTLRPQALPVVLADQDRLGVPVTVNASRCDAHALAESKRSYDFQAAVRLGDGELLTVTVKPGPRGLALLERLLADTCVPG
jgi:hypothetical protein